jgi:hypothetical protein
VTRIDPGVISLLAELRGADSGATWIAGTKRVSRSLSPCVRGSQP